MNDTPQHVLDKQREIVHAKTPNERFLLGIDIIDMNYKIVKDSILKAQPNLSPKELTAAIFLRFYKNDFSPTQLKAIASAMQQ